MLALATMAATGVTTAHAQRDRTTPAQPSYMVISADNVYVRAGAGDSYYPFGKVHKGDVVKVVGEKHYWARVHTVGPAFEKFFGYVRFPRGGTTLLRLEDGGRTGRTLGKVDLLAPNLNTDYKPGDSWKRIHELPADATVSVLETFETERYTVHKVVLPVTAEGWISTSFVTPATPEQVAAWQERMRVAAGGKPAPKEEKTRTAAAATTPAGAAADPDAGARPAQPVLGREEPVFPPATDVIPADATRRPGMDPEAPAPGREIGTDAGADRGVAAPATPPAATEVEMGAPTTPAAPVVTGTPRERLQALEAAYERLRAEPITEAEVLPLRQLYVALGREADDAVVIRYAEARAEQLTIWADLQKRRAELDKLRKRVDVSAGEAEAARLAQEQSGAYVAVGRLTASVVYDGRRLPRLFRVQDTTTGRTVAYMRPDDGFDLHPMLGQTIGVIGKPVVVEDLGVTLVSPKRIDLLTATSAGASSG
jgi:hypothetical protein